MGIIIFLFICSLIGIGTTYGLWKFSHETAAGFYFAFSLLLIVATIIITCLYIKASYATYMYNLIKGTNIPVDSWFYLGGS
jgi:hypothetical protein